MSNTNHDTRNRSFSIGAAGASYRQSVSDVVLFHGDNTLFDDDARIDWDRKQKRRRETRDEDVEDLVVIDEDRVEVLRPGKARSVSGVSRKKKRQFVYDEESDRVVVRRRRKRQRDNYDDDW